MDNKGKKEITNLNDTRLCVRVDLELKKWIALNGGSKFVRSLLVTAYENIEKEKFISEFSV